MSKLIEGKIECPFYIKEGEYFIRCEGVLKNTECVHSVGALKELFEMLCEYEDEKPCDDAVVIRIEKEAEEWGK